jgi:hypothetical protein
MIPASRAGDIKIKKKPSYKDLYNIFVTKSYFQRLGLASDETDSFFLPFLLLAFNTFLPALLDILSLNPCLFFRFLFEG